MVQALVDDVPVPSFPIPVPRTLDQIVEDARQLPREQVAELVDRLTMDLAKGMDPGTENAWTDTAMRRLAEMESGKVKPVPGDEVMARARKIVGR